MTTHERIRRHYNTLIDEWGVGDHRALGYLSGSNQAARYSAIGQLYRGRGSILDVGCGTGDLLDYLREGFSPVEYVGVDQQPEFIDYARRKYAMDAQARFITGDFLTTDLPEQDVVIACGVLSFRSPEARYLELCIERLFLASRRLFIFNLLNASRMFPTAELIGYTPSLIVEFCQTLTPHVRMLEGYLPFDFTVALSKDESVEWE